MKKIFFVIVLVAFVGCHNEASKSDAIHNPPSVKSITEDMGCENCRMNIEKFLLTGHAIQTEDGNNHYYCSINCCTAAWNRNDFSEVAVFAFDNESIEFVPVDSVYYVVGSKQPAVMSKVSKYAFKNPEKAEQFKIEHEGEAVLRYKEVFLMCEEELAKR